MTFRLHCFLWPQFALQCVTRVSSAFSVVCLWPFSVRTDMWRTFGVHRYESIMFQQPQDSAVSPQVLLFQICLHSSASYVQDVFVKLGTVVLTHFSLYFFCGNQDYGVKHDKYFIFVIYCDVIQTTVQKCLEFLVCHSMGTWCTTEQSTLCCRK